MWRRCVFCLDAIEAGYEIWCDLTSELVTRSLVLSDYGDKYTILIKGETKFKNLTEEEYFDIMDDLAVEYYQTGRPRPSDIETKVFGDYS